MSALSILEIHKQEVLRLARQHGAGQLRVFGSTVRGDDSEESDIDLLIHWDDRASLCDWAALQEKLQHLLGRRVDLVSDAGLHWYVRDRILAEAKPLA